MSYLLAIDQGTTNSRAIVFRPDGNPHSQSERSLAQSFPQDGWVEQDPLEMFNNIVFCCREALKNGSLLAEEIAAIGITNQRETTIIWDRETGLPIYPAIVWQDRRTHALCKELAEGGLENIIYQKTGLLLDPYFSATKILWILDQVPKARQRAERGELAFGTVDSYLLWKLTAGASHFTDITNASRTMLFNIHTQQWDPELLAAIHVPLALMPVVLDNTADFGYLEESILGKKLPILGMAGDQQAAAIGQACFSAGMIKTTLGTGCFMLLNTGPKPVQSHHRLLTTIAYRIRGKTHYALEGSIFCAGTTVKWLRDNLQLIKSAAETETLAESIKDCEGVYFVPAFTGLGAPYWDPAARAVLCGLTLSSGKAEIARAALESVAYQACDLIEAIRKDSSLPLELMRVDGGMAANHWLLQFLADMLNLEVQPAACLETTALGVAYLAGLQAGIYGSLEEIAGLRQSIASFAPKLSKEWRYDLYKGWKLAVQRVKSDLCL